MCAVFGALVWNLTTPAKALAATGILRYIYTMSHERGRDGRGVVSISSNFAGTRGFRDTRRSKVGPDDTMGDLNLMPMEHGAVIGNLRAEPTTEYTEFKKAYDQQPYSKIPWSIVHNGTIANDFALRNGSYPSRIDSAAIIETLVEMDKAAPEKESSTDIFEYAIRSLAGSYAILAIREEEPNLMHVAVNYRPVWYVQTEYGFFFASSRDYFPSHLQPVMIRPYTISTFGYVGSKPVIATRELIKAKGPRRALVVCSGGLDSVVAATYAQRRQQYEIELLHFRYGSRAEDPEVKAIKKIARALKTKAHITDMAIYGPEDSNLLNENSKLAGGEAGAEFAHEWVPARNLVMLSIATAFAEAKGFDTIILGNNLEEAGAYPDNEPEFINRFNDVLPFAVASGKRVRVEMPVGNLMKHEIVALGTDIGAPLHLTWSCYRAGKLHCGQCGPCFMRRTAFAINKINEVINYAS
jgi:7-cyano-7-deazaguanine synthase